MKKQIFLTYALISFIVCELQASFDYDYWSPWYLSGIAGANYVDDEFVIGPQLGLALGVRLSYGFRLEGEFVACINKVKEFSAEYGTCTLGANILYDFSFINVFKPFIGLGIGGQHRFVDVRDGEYHVHWSGEVVTYQGIAGAYIPIWKNTLTSLDYRYIANNKGSDTSQSLGFTVKRHF